MINLMNYVKNQGLLLRITRKLYPRFGINLSDIFLVTFPKSGTTWLRFIFGNIVSLIYLDGRVVDYHLLNGELRCAFDSFHFPTLWPKILPRIFVSHQAYSHRKFYKNKCIYLYRNPGDVMVSFYHHRKSLLGGNKFNGSFKSFIKNEEFGIPAWCRHYIEWEQKADIIISYEDLKRDPHETMIHILRKLSLKNIVTNQILVESIRRSSFDNIKTIENERGLDKKAAEIHNSNFKFARKGKIGEWNEYFDNDDLIYLQSTLKNANLSWEKFVK